MIGDGLSLEANTGFNELIAPYLYQNIAFDKQWKPITDPATARSKIQYLEANAASVLVERYLDINRRKVALALRKRGVNFNALDSYARLAIEDLAYNVGPYFTYNKMVEALAKPTPDYVRAAYELCDSKDFERFGGLRERRITEAHLMLMAAKRSGGLDVYFHKYDKQPSPNEGTEVTEVPSQSGTTTYCVGEKDNVYSISRRFGSSVEDIIADNKLDSKGTIVPGQNLIIRLKKDEKPNLEPPKPSPNAVWHTVQPGETLSGIAASNGVKLSSLKALNSGLKSFNLLKVGSRIRIK